MNVNATAVPVLEVWGIDGDQFALWEPAKGQTAPITDAHALGLARDGACNFTSGAWDRVKQLRAEIMVAAFRARNGI